MSAPVPSPHRFLGFVQIILASVCFGFLGIFGKLAYNNGIPIGELLTFRFILASIVLWVVLILFRPEWTKISGPQFLISAGLGIFGYALFATLYFKALEGLSVALAALLLFTYPLWVQIIAAFMGEKPTAWQVLCSAIVFCGLVFLLWGQISITSFAAFAYALGGAISYAVYIIVSGRYQSQIRPLTSSLYVTTFSALALMVFHNPSMGRIEEYSLLQSQIIFGLALVSTIVPMTLVLASLQKLKKTEVALLSTLEPVVATLASWLLLGEKLLPLQVIGGILILFGLALRFRERMDPEITGVVPNP